MAFFKEWGCISLCKQAFQIIIDLYLVSVGQVLFGAGLNVAEMSVGGLNLPWMSLWLRLYIYMIVSHQRHLCERVSQEAARYFLLIHAVIKRFRGL